MNGCPRGHSRAVIPEELGMGIGLEGFSPVLVYSLAQGEYNGKSRVKKQTF